MSNARRQSSKTFTDTGDHEEEGPPAAKRPRVAAACDQCRLRKAKCDAVKPVCGPCVRRNDPASTCEWGQRRGRGATKTKTKELIKLSQRIDELERENRSLVSSSNQGISQGQRPIALNRESSVDVDEQHIESNAMMGFDEHGDDGTPEQFRQSNAASFMHLIRGLIDPVKPAYQSNESQTSVNAPRRRPRTQKASVRRPRLPDYALPSRPRADHLMSVYRRLAATLYPFVDLGQVQTLYQRLWTGEDLGDDGLTFICMINVIFGIACNLDSSTAPNERVSSANTFYSRAQDLLQFDIVEQRSILSVECFLLLGQYLQSTNNPQQCWIYVGFAIRIAQSLRLDIPSTSAKEPPLQREILRRLWYGCVLLDQTLSMTFGRSAMITPQASVIIPLPLAHPDNVQCQCHTTHLKDSSMADFHFFIETLRLYRLMNETLITLYGSDSIQDDGHNLNVVYFGSLGAQAVGSLLELDHKLSCWHQSSPIHLRLGLNNTQVDGHERHRVVLYIRYTHVKILLFRPILARYCSAQVFRVVDPTSITDSLPGKIALQFSVACIKAALNTIDCFDQSLSGKDIGKVDDLLPAWWYSIFYVYTAATVLVAARLSPSILAELTEQAVSEAWDKAMNILSRYQAFTNLARRCATALNLLLNQVLQQEQRSRSRQTPDGDDLLSNSMAGPRPQPVCGTSAQAPTGIPTDNWAPFGMEFMMRSGSLESDLDVENLVREMNTSGMQFDIFGDMSWLTDMPSQLY